MTYLNRQTGLCKRCTEFQHVEEERAFNDLLEAERAYAEHSPEIEAAKHKYDMLRQRNARLCRRYGLKGKADRKSSGDYAIIGSNIQRNDKEIT